ncbi:hypothetical protein CaCOL14_004343 [Colletotrichum acutatum]
MHASRVSPLPGRVLELARAFRCHRGPSHKINFPSKKAHESLTTATTQSDQTRPPSVVANPPRKIPPRCLAKSVISSSSLRLPGERTLPPLASRRAPRTPRSSSRSAASATSTPSSSRTPTRPRSSSSPSPLSSRSRTSPRRTPRASPPHKGFP